jgi:hypothetical protein
LTGACEQPGRPGLIRAHLIDTHHISLCVSGVAIV